MSNSNQQGNILGENDSKATTTNSNLSTTSSWCFCHFTFVAFYFVAASIQETVGGVLFIMSLFLSSTAIIMKSNTIPLPVIYCVWLYCDNPRHSVLWDHQVTVLCGERCHTFWSYNHDHLIFLCHHLQTLLSTLGFFCYYLNTPAPFLFMHTRTN